MTPPHTRGGAVGRFRTGHRLPALALALALLAAACDRPLTSTAPVPGGADRSLVGADEIVLVGFDAPPGAAEIALVESLGGRVRHQFKHIPVLSASLPADQRETLAAAPGVAYVEPNRSFVPLGGKQITDYGVSKIEAPAAWRLGYEGQAVKVGIFDSGIDIDHPDLRVAGGVDLMGDGHGLDDCNGHGTHVAGIVGALNNGRYTVGVAPRAELYSMRFADCAWENATSERMLLGVEWAIDNGMDVVNMSFGYLEPIPYESEEAAFNAAYQAGIVLVGASGNSSAPYVGYPAAYPSVIAVGATDENDALAGFSQWGTEQDLTAPGVNNLASYLVGQGQSTSLFVNTDNERELEAIGLAYAGKTDRKGITTDVVYAGLGTAVEFESVSCDGRIALVTRGGITFAEKTAEAMRAGCLGVIIHNNQPGNFNGTLCADPPTAECTATPWIPAVSISLDEGLYLKEQVESRTTEVTLINAAGDLAILSGTSMASPNAAGVAALVLSKNPSLTPDQVRSILYRSAQDLGPAGWDPQFGHGRVNARRAVEATQ